MSLPVDAASCLPLRGPLSALLLALLVACAADDAGPATPGSASAEAAAEAAEIAQEAEAVEALAREVTAEMDGARRRVNQGDRTIDEESASIREKVRVLDERHDALQARIQAWEDKLHTSSSDPAWPQTPVKGNR
jgi:hypothetical protein